MTPKGAVVAPAPAPWRVVYLAGELFWFLVLIAVIPVGVLAIGLPLALVVRLLLSLTGLH